MEDIKYDLFVLQRMLEQLPTSVRKPCLDQLQKISRGLEINKEQIMAKLEELRLDIKAMQFDLEATKRERDAFKKQLEE